MYNKDNFSNINENEIFLFVLNIYVPTLFQKLKMNELYECLNVFFIPIFDYSDKSCQVYNDQGQLEQPLWLFRYFNLFNRNIIEKIMKLVECNENYSDVEIFLAKTLLLTIDNKKENYDQIEKLKLIDIAQGAQFSNYALSLLVTFLLRSAETSDQNIGINILDKGSYQGDLWKKKVNFDFKEEKPFKKVYIELSHMNIGGELLKESDLSGQNLCGLNAKFKKLEGIKFRWTCLDSACFTNSELERIDFYGSSFCKADLKSSKIKLSCFDKTNLFEANFRDTGFDTIHFNTRLELLKIEQFICAHSFINCSIIETQFEINNDLTRLKTKHPQLEIKKDESNHSSEIEKLHSEIIDKEKLNDMKSAKPWPINSFEHELNFQNDKFISGNFESCKDIICFLNLQDPLSKILNHFLHSTSDYVEYKSMWFEPARLLHAIGDGSGVDFFKNETKFGPPEHKARVGNITISNIFLVKNPSAWKVYQDEKQIVKRFLLQKNIKNPLSDVNWHSFHKKKMHILNEELGEVWLFHGTNYEKCPLIINNGFTTKFKQKNLFTGYGALGKGIYCSDAFSKALTYATCPQCAKTSCSCGKIKAIILARAVLGNIYQDLYKKRSFEEDVPSGYNSSWGPSKKFKKKSKFDCNEFCVPEKQIYPEFCIFYTENEDTISEHNSLIPDNAKWENEIKVKLNECGMIKDRINDLDQLLKDYYLLCKHGWLEDRMHYLKSKIKPAVDSYLYNEVEKKRSDSTLVNTIKTINHSILNEIAAIDLANLDSAIYYHYDKEIIISYFFVTKNWYKLIAELDMFTDEISGYSLTKILMYHLMRAIAYREIRYNDDLKICKNFFDIIQMKRNLNENEVILNIKKDYAKLNEEIAAFYHYFVSRFSNDFIQDIRSLESFDIVFEDFALFLVQKVVENDDDFEFYYFLFNQSEREILLGKLNLFLENNNNPRIKETFENKINNLSDKLGIKKAVLGKKYEWNRILNERIATSDHTICQMSWIETPSDNQEPKLKQLYLKQEWVNLLFNENGSKNWEDREQQGLLFL